jgi:hypothetical protein
LGILLRPGHDTQGHISTINVGASQMLIVEM